MKIFKIGIIVFNLLLVSSCNSLSKQIELAYSEELRRVILEELVQEVSLDTSENPIYLIALEGIEGVCGNDPRYDGITTLEEMKLHNEYVRANPYYIDHNNWKHNYAIQRKNIVTGSIFRTKFFSEKIRFDLDSLKAPIQLYRIEFGSIKKDTVNVKFLDYSEKNKKELNLTMVLNEAVWSRLK